MGSTGPSQKSEIPNPTRQKLDELDLLIQRMLAIPVNRLDPGLLDSTEYQKEVNEPPNMEPSEQATLQSSPIESPVELKAILLPEATVILDLGSQDKAALDAAPMPLVGANWGANTADEVHGFIDWINRLFDGTTFFLGPPGRWLREPAGRSILGWIGIGCLIAALVWGFLDLVGWIT